MSRSRKKNNIYNFVWRSAKWGKRYSHKAFRARERAVTNVTKFPKRLTEVVNASIVGAKAFYRKQSEK